jgi:hypothetical protein
VRRWVRRAVSSVLKDSWVYVSSVNAGQEEMLGLRGGTKRNGVEGGEWEGGRSVWEGTANGDGRRCAVIGSGSDHGR